MSRQAAISLISFAEEAFKKNCVESDCDPQRLKFYRWQNDILHPYLSRRWATSNFEASASLPLFDKWATREGLRKIGYHFVHRVKEPEKPEIRYDLAKDSYAFDSEHVRWSTETYLREFTQYWLASAFMLSIEKCRAVSVSRHGPVFIRAFISMANRLLLSGRAEQELVSLARSSDLAVAPAEVDGARAHWLRTNFWIDGPEQRSLIEALARLDKMSGGSES